MSNQNVILDMPAYKFYAYIKKSVWNVKKGNWLLQKQINIFTEFIFKFPPNSLE